MLLKDYLVTWFDLHKTTLNLEWARTIEKYHLPKILEGLGDIDIVELTSLRVASWYHKQCMRSQAVASKCLVTLKQALSYAVQTGLLAQSPAAKIKSIKYSNPRVVRFEDKLKQELLTLSNPRLRPYLLLAFSAPARRRSLLGLKLEDIDITRSTVTYKKTKNGKNVTLPIEPGVLQELLKTSGACYLLPRYKPGSISRGFKRLTERLGYKGLRFHDIRHDVASRLAEAGVNQSVIAAILGHSDIRSTARYIHPSESSLREAMTKVAVNAKGVYRGLK